MRKVYVIGSYSTQFKKWPEKSFKELTREAYLGALHDAGLGNGDAIQFAWFGNCMLGHWNQMVIRGQVCFVPLVREGLFPERVPIINVEGGCATASMAFHGAYKDILSGQCEVSFAIGVEKLFNPSKSKEEIFALFDNGIDNLNPEETINVYKETANKIGREFQTGKDRSMFMDTYAIQTCYHMWKYGTTQRQIAVGASKNHSFGALNPKSQYQFRMSVEEVLNDRMIAYPLTRSMCAPIGDGSAAAILCSGEFLNDLPSAVRNRSVRVLSSALSGGKYRSPDEPSLSRIAAQKAYKLAGIGPHDIDVAEVHDATSFCEIYQSEMLGFCSEGEGGKFVESGATSLDGKLPINTSGGLVSKGHPVGATGLSMIYELITQLRAEAGPRQVKNAEFALQENGGGVIGLEEAACSVVILQKDR